MACLLYYQYQDDEDNLTSTDYSMFKCMNCAKLPHETYFNSIKFRLCYKCHSSTQNKGELCPELSSCIGCKEMTHTAQLVDSFGCGHLTCTKCTAPSFQRGSCIHCGEELKLLCRICNQKQPVSKFINNKQCKCMVCEICFTLWKDSNFYSCGLCKVPFEREDLLECMDCTRRVPKKNAQVLDCSHIFCNVCFRKSVNKQIQFKDIEEHYNSGRVNITCNVCHTYIHQKYFESYVNNENQKAYYSLVHKLSPQKCEHCMHEFSKDMMIRLECRHLFNKNCLNKHFTRLLRSGSHNLKCIVGCYNVIYDKVIQNLLDEHYYNIYIKFKYHPVLCPGCGREYRSIQDISSLRCTKCRTKFCGDCGSDNKYDNHNGECKFYQSPYDY